MSLPLILFSVLLCMSFSKAGKIEENTGFKGLYEGDILLNRDQRIALASGDTRGLGTRRWPGAVVPYSFSAPIQQVAELIKFAMREWEVQTCIKFRPRTDEAAYILFTKGKGCFSSVGYQGNKQIISIGEKCVGRRRILHDIGHALGFFHEQARPDRDMYVNIHWENIQSGESANFDKLTSVEQQSWMPYGTPYDYYSIMHFSAFEYTKNGEPTITPKEKWVKIRDLGALDISYLDLQQVNLMYNCPGNVKNYLVTVCENKKRRITCFGGRKLKIVYANYGRKSFSKCGIGFNTNCGDASSFKKVSDMCDGRSSCELHASNSVFGNPCSLTRKYLSARYECHP